MIRPADFVAYHAPALEADETRHNLILGLLGSVGEEWPDGFLHWTLGDPGSCAIRTAPDRPIILGELDERRCRELAEMTAQLEYHGVIGPDATAEWFVDRANALGLEFKDPVPQQILALAIPPEYPAASGHARQVAAEDAPLFADWMLAFLHEAVPHDPVPSREHIEGMAASDRYWFWVDDDRAVAMAGIARRTRNAAAISAVYTLPEFRGRGYAGSVTAAVAEKIFAEGKKLACLYMDERNRAAGRAYARTGFKPVCRSSLFPRLLQQA